MESLWLDEPQGQNIVGLSPSVPTKSAPMTTTDPYIVSKHELSSVVHGDYKSIALLQ